MTNATIKRHIQAYYATHLSIKELKAKQDKSKSKLHDYMLASDTKQLKHEFCTLSLVSGRKTYEYSDKVKALETKLKELKKLEELSVPFTSAPAFTKITVK